MLGCFRIEEIRGDDNETNLKEGRGIEMSNLQCFPYTRCSLSFAFVFTYPKDVAAAPKHISKVVRSGFVPLEYVHGEVLSTLSPTTHLFPLPVN